jgi:thiol-disulfide isomerase/thioredoxin
MKILQSILIIIFPFLGFAQPVTIRGSAPGAEGKRIEVIRFSDLITFREKTIAVTLVDSTGMFTTSFNIDQTIFVNLSIDFHRGGLFIQPSKSYDITIAPMNYNDIKEVNPFVQSAKLEIGFKVDDLGELNTQINSFNKLYDDFLLNNFNALYRDRNKVKLDTFRNQISNNFMDMNDPYLTNYIKYKIGSLVQLNQSMSQPQIGYVYFSEPAVLYENVEYMDFFNQFFAKYITATSRSLKFTDYQTILNGIDSYKKMMKALEADTILKKPQLRELVMLKGLMEMYNTTSFKQEKIVDLLKSVMVETKFPQNRQIAEKMISLLTKLRAGTPAYGFKLLDRTQKEVTLADFKGKPVVLNFWTTYCQACISEMDRMKQLYDKYSNQVSFISISADKDFKKMLYFINLKSDFVWNFLHVGDDYDLLKEYDVRSYPLFVLIDKDGNIVQCPAELPGSGLEAALQKLIN